MVWYRKYKQTNEQMNTRTHINKKFHSKKKNKIDIIIVSHCYRYYYYFLHCYKTAIVQKCHLKQC